MTRRCFNCAPESCMCDEPSSRPVGETNDQRYHRLVWEHDAAFRRWIQTLAHNLAIVAALCGWSGLERAYESGYLARCIKFVSPQYWHRRQGERALQRAKKTFGVCGEDDCEEPVKGHAHLEPGDDPGPFDQGACAKHAAELEAEHARDMAEGDEYDPEDEDEDLS